MIDQGALAAALGRALSAPKLGVERVSRVGGGCIDTALVIDTAGRRLFVKIANCRARLEAEADGLRALAECTALRVPAVLGIADLGVDEQSLLALEYLPLKADGDDAALGRAIAGLHRIHGPRFGWRRDNFIGATPQANGWADDWADFFADRRLRPQLALAAQRGADDLAGRAEPLLDALPALFADDPPQPSLVHGDLWRGNVGFVDGKPAVFDPAVHYGDSEADLAMSDLFGGFGPRFYAAYHALRPPAAAASLRRDLYSLYHVLNHYSLFGGHYADQARRLIARLAAATGAR